MFSFTGADGWKQGPSNTTSMALFYDHSCFVSVEYKLGTVNEQAELQKVKADLSAIGYTAKPLADTQATIRNGDVDTPYSLHQFVVTGTEKTPQVKEGQEFGYLQLENGYVISKGYCDTTSQLPLTIPVLKSIKLTLSR
ncbi:MAG: hypothetical protein WBB33_01260 [Candidatus Saccharimonadales bacterium]